MRYLFPVLVLTLICCSKPSGETGPADNTATAAPQVTDAEKVRLITLTDEELAEVHAAIFQRIHDFQTFSGDPYRVAEKEAYVVNNNSFSYELIRYNVQNGEFDTPFYNETDHPLYVDPWDLVYAREAEAVGNDKIAGGDPEAEAYSEGEGDDEYGEGDSYEDYHVAEGYYLNEYDTVKGYGMFVAMLESKPEDPIKVVRCRISGEMKWLNYHYKHYGELTPEPKFYTLDDIVVEIGIPKRDRLYFKAAIMPLSDKDVAGMSKDDLGYLRNEIFARHGHRFKTDKMIKYFADQPWYSEWIDDAAPLLNKFEKQNVEFLKKKEG